MPFASTTLGYRTSSHTEAGVGREPNGKQDCLLKLTPGIRDLRNPIQDMSSA
jgi:hypothetical protein